MGKKFSGRRPEDQPMYLKSNQLDYEKRRLIVTSIDPSFKRLLDFLGLSDTPNSYSGQAGKVVKVNPAENALIFGSTEDGWVWDGGSATIAITNSIVLIYDLGGAI